LSIDEKEQHMKLAFAALAAVGTLGVSLLSPAPAAARFFGGHVLEAPSLLETVQACRTRTVRTVRNGRVIVRTVRDCAPRRGVTVIPGFRVVTPAVRSGCRIVQTRTRVGNRTVVRSVRRC
jgi:hypothetical protein